MSNISSLSTAKMKKLKKNAQITYQYKSPNRYKKIGKVGNLKIVNGEKVELDMENYNKVIVLDKHGNMIDKNFKYKKGD
ncbi:MAG: hypothetical protein ACOCRK_07945 [bacterium]